MLGKLRWRAWLAVSWLIFGIIGPEKLIRLIIRYRMFPRFRQRPASVGAFIDFVLKGFFLEYKNHCLQRALLALAFMLNYGLGGRAVIGALKEKSGWALHIWVADHFGSNVSDQLFEGDYKPLHEIPF